MKQEPSAPGLSSRLRFCYLAWPLSLLAVIALIGLYRRDNPENQPKSEAQLRSEIAACKLQLEQTSAALLGNQRALSECQQELTQANEAIVKLQAAAH